jgi:hypothetical protein
MTVILDTIRFWSGRFWLVVVLSGGIWLSGCGDKAPAMNATLTFKRDGSHFSGTVIRREPGSITLTNASGETHTYLYSELADIRYESPEPPVSSSGVQSQTAKPEAAVDSRSPAQPPASSSPSAAEIKLPAGIEVPVASSGLLDSSFVPMSAITLGVVDSDVKTADGKVLIPAGANVTMLVQDKKVVSGRVQMVFEVVSADFNNRHYQVSSEKGPLQPGAMATFVGAQPGSQEAKLRGTNIHIDDHSLMTFKTETPTLIKVSQ